MKAPLLPPPSRDLSLARLEVRKEALMKEITKEQKRPTLQKRRRRAAAILLPAAVLVVAATSYVVLKADEAVADGIGCYEVADENSNVAIISTTGEHPVDICTELWNRGHLGSGDAPSMTACASEGGAIHVFPSDEENICVSLGYQDLPDGYLREAKRFVAMRDAVVERMYEAATAGAATERSACLSEEDAVEIVRQVLSDHGFDDWTAEVATGDYEGRECANAAGFEDADKKVLIVPTFRDEGIDPNPFGPH
jgi:hypothetical protein